MNISIIGSYDIVASIKLQINQLIILKQLKEVHYGGDSDQGR